jgi:hypothetical protein
MLRRHWAWVTSVLPSQNGLSGQFHKYEDVLNLAQNALGL